MVAEAGGPVIRKPLVSVGLPTYNRAATLRRAVESVLAQDWGELELVISDNASTDDTEPLCEGFRRADERVRYIRQPVNIGAEANFREALAHSRGELFMWLGDDDWLDTSYVSECARILVEQSDHALVCGRAKYFRDGRFAFAERDVNLLRESGRARLLGFYRTVTLNGPFYGVMRREQLSQLPFPTSLGGDWLLIASLAYLGKIRTLRNVSINRSVEGASKDEEGLARAFGLSRSQARSWHLLVARAAFAEIVRGPVYRPLRKAERLALGSGAFALIAARFSWKVWLGRALARLGLLDRARGALESYRRSVR